MSININDNFYATYKLGIEKGIKIGRYQAFREMQKIMDKHESEKLPPETGGAITVADELGNDVEIEMSARTTDQIPGHHYNNDEPLEY